MIKIEALTLEDAYKDAASSLDCSVTQLKIEVVQYPSGGIFGLFKKNAIIVAMKEEEKAKDNKQETIKQETTTKQKQKSFKKQESFQKQTPISKEKETPKSHKNTTNVLNDTIMPESFVSTQADDSYLNEAEYSADRGSMEQIAQEVKKDINNLFEKICFKIDEIQVSVYDENTLLVEFKGEDSALLIGKEGYRYKALSYMIFNWINAKYQVQLRLEIAEFLKNQEESISRYLVSVCESVDRDGRTQTKVLDGVLVQIALKELRNIYPDKYVAIRSTRDGMKYIIINDYHPN